MTKFNELYESILEGKKKIVDLKGAKCTTCKKGTYQETGPQDDMRGELHCTNCGTRVKRHQEIKEIKIKEIKIKEAKVKIDTSAYNEKPKGNKRWLFSPTTSSKDAETFESGYGQAAKNAKEHFGNQGHTTIYLIGHE